MTKIDRTYLLEKYRLGELTDLESREMEKAITQGEILLDELEGFDEVREMVNEVHVIPSTALDNRINELIHKYKQNGRLREMGNWLTRIAAAVILLVSAFWLGSHYNNHEVEQPAQGDLVSLMNMSKVSDKIHLINNINLDNEGNAQTNAEMLDALFFTLNNDPSNNVRLACIETIAAFGSIPEVRQRIVESIRNQNSPMVIASLSLTIKQLGASITNDQILDLVDKNIPAPMLEAVKTNLLNL